MDTLDIYNYIRQLYLNKVERQTSFLSRDVCGAAKMTNLETCVFDILSHGEVISILIRIFIPSAKNGQVFCFHLSGSSILVYFFPFNYSVVTSNQIGKTHEI